MPRIRKAVFPAAGLGTRFLPATKAIPKEMIPIVDKPSIQYVVEEAVASGITHIILITSRGKSAIEDHFDVAFELEKTLEGRGKTDLLEQVRSITSMVQFSAVRQGVALGLGHAVLQARDLVGDEPFAVMLGDDLVDNPVPCLKQMIDVFDRHGDPVVALQQVPHAEISKYGVIGGAALAGEPGTWRVDELVEKPPVESAPSDLAIIGRYILTPDVFDALEKTPRDGSGEIQLTNGLRDLRARRAIYGCCFEGVRHDAGNKLGYLKATVELALGRPDLGGPFRDYLRSLDLSS